MLELAAELANRLAGDCSVADDLVVDVRDVHHVVDGHAMQLYDTAQHIDMQEGAEIADVAVVVHRRPAAIEAQGVPIGSVKRFDDSGKSIEEFERHAGCVWLSG